jgi:hypothetical protein
LKRKTATDAEAAPDSTQKPAPKRPRKAPVKLKTSSKKAPKDKAPASTSDLEPFHGNVGQFSALAHSWLAQITEDVISKFGILTPTVARTALMTTET